MNNSRQQFVSRLRNIVKKEQLMAGFYIIMKNLGYRKSLQLYELLELGGQILRSRVTHVIKKSELSISKVYIKRKLK